METLKRSSKVWLRELRSNLNIFWGTIESEISKNGAASYVFPLQRCIFGFLCASLAGVDVSVSPDIAESGWKTLNTWLALQVIPTTKLGVLPQPLEEILLHTWAYPSQIVAGNYKKLYDFIDENAGDCIRCGQEDFGLTREEAIHNLLFVMGFNAYGGFSVFLPSLIGRITGDSGLQERIRSEVRRVCGSGSDLDYKTVNEMELVKSVVYETLRFSPPVPLQFARARKDFQISSHDSVFEVKKGELLCGYQPMVMRDGNVFDEPDEFKPDRYIGQTGSELLDYLYWSNGPQTGTPSAANKQCAAKDMVTLTASLIVADLFLRYDSITGDSGSIKSVVKAT
ncbi:PREDICTED: probable inactive linolenate hydroperoxide lyase [Camelina sativa]|nr:PREDICTED: probable inactive linolenate hydroperoxide lyase [Camelina sativa]